MLADLASAEKRVASGKKTPKGGLAGWNSESEASMAAALLKESLKLLVEGLPVSKLVPGLNPMELGILRRCVGGGRVATCQ